MKSILTILLLLTLGTSALENTIKQYDKIKPIKVGLFLVIHSYRVIDTRTVKTDPNQKMTRLYPRENTLMDKALCFTIEGNKGNLA